MSKSEKAIQNEILLAITPEERAMFWREQSAKAWVGRMQSYKNGVVTLAKAQPIVAGVPGIADIMGLVDGRPVAVEVKTLTGQQEDSQRRFQRAFEAAGGIYGVARSADEALEIVLRARKD